MASSSVQADRRPAGRRLSQRTAGGVGPLGLGIATLWLSLIVLLPLAAISAKAFDNGMVCASEQAVILDEPIAAEALAEFARLHAYMATPAEKRLLEEFIFGVTAAASDNTRPEIDRSGNADSSVLNQVEYGSR